MTAKTVVLELYPKDTYVTYPYLEYHDSRLLSPIRLLRYLITKKTYVKFLLTTGFVA